MALIVQKYGGTSVGSPERIRAVAARVARARRCGNQLVVVVSAMGETTDQLIELARAVHPDPPQREMDMLLTAGERISMALLAMALRQEDIEAISFTGSQSGIITDSTHGRARILEVRGERIREELARERVVIVAGFQGVSRQREITTLGRGGSDTTAVAIAASLGAQLCEIYTDVPGILSADPRCVPAARPLGNLSPRVALTLTSLGAGVLSPRAAALGCRLHMPIVVRSSWDEAPGTRIEEDPEMENEGVAAVTSTGPVVVLEQAGGQGTLKSAPCAILGLSQDFHSSTTRLAVAECDAELLPGCTQLARGSLVSIVIHGPMTTTLATRALEVARTHQTPILAAFGGPCSYSAVVPEEHATPLVQAWHKEFIEKS